MSDTCPKCGSPRVRTITPTFFECENEEVLETVIPPYAQGNPGPIPIYRRCGHRFQVDTPATSEPCWCGRHSIGRCKDCSRPLCGLHGSRGDLFLCSDCSGKRARVAAESGRTAVAALAREWDDWARQFRTELLATKDPIERLVRFVGQFNPDDDLKGLRWRTARSSFDSEILKLLPILDGWDPALRSPPWDHDRVQSWFLEAVQEPPREYRIVTWERQRLLAKEVKTVVAGWTFDKGNIERNRGGSGHIYDVTVLVDGRRGRVDWDGAPYSGKWLGEDTAGFNLVALHEMSRLARLPALPARPTRPRPYKPDEAGERQV